MAFHKNLPKYKKIICNEHVSNVLYSTLHENWICYVEKFREIDCNNHLKIGLNCPKTTFISYISQRGCMNMNHKRN